MNTYVVAFLTGLTSGGISCIAIQGGFLASAIATIKKENNIFKNNLLYVSAFLTAKIISYTILGAIMGLIGTILKITIQTQAIFQLAIGIFLLGTSLRLMNIHPIFRYFSITPPKIVYKLARKNSMQSNYTTPFILGILTVLMPCGVTQAMMVLAIGTGNYLQGALIMFAFTLGTSPIFLAIGTITAQFMKMKLFSYISAGIIGLFGIISLNGAMGLLGSPHTIQNYWKVITGSVEYQNTGYLKGNSAETTQEATITVLNNGYRSDIDTLKVNVPLKLKLITNNTSGCARAFTIPSLNISKILPETGVETIEFTPTKIGRLAYSCSMGMYTGSFQVTQ